MDDYSEHPKSVTELNAERTYQANKPAWGILKPRDVLIDMLRKIDSGEIKPDALVCVMQFKDDDGFGNATIASAAPDFITALGLIARATHILQS